MKHNYEDFTERNTKEKEKIIFLNEEGCVPLKNLLFSVTRRNTTPLHRKDALIQ